LAKEKGHRVRTYFNSETKVLLEKYKRIESFLPSSKRAGASHTGEEGRFIEALIREFLNKHLPSNIEAGTGFIYRPATKTGKNNRTRRRTETDKHSKQLDIIIFDNFNYPIFESFEEFMIVPPEGVIGIVSVKKNLYNDQIEDELKALAQAASLCTHKNNKNEFVRGPNTSLISFSNKLSSKKYEGATNLIYKNITGVHKSHFFDQCISQIVCLDQFSIFKKRPSFDDKGEFLKKAEYISFKHEDIEGYHFGLQFILTGILSVLYDETRNLTTRPGYTAFPTDRKFDKLLGEIKVSKLR